MNLSYSILDTPFEIDEGDICVITIENVEEFRNVIQGFANSDSRIEFFEKESPLEQKYIEYITDIPSLNINDKKLSTKLLKHFESILKDDLHFEKTEVVSNTIRNYMEEAIFDSNLPLDISDDIDIQGLMKSVGLKFRDDSETFLENLINYMDILMSFCYTKLFVFCNLSLFLSNAEFDELMRYTKSQNTHIISVERTNVLNNKSLLIKQILFDEDLCRIL